MREFSLRTVVMATALAAGSIAMVGCTTTKPETSSAPRADATTVNARANAALERLYQTAPGSREMVARARGVLIFPSVIGGSFVIGVEHGRGFL
jgi:lipid-binding SYLF domain-containing protein